MFGNHGTRSPALLSVRSSCVNTPNDLIWADKLSHGLAHITRLSPIAVGDHRSALMTGDARSKIVHDIMILFMKS